MKVTECTSLLSKFDAIDLEEVDIRREGAQQVENVVATVIPDDAWNQILDSIVFIGSYLPYMF